MKTNCRNSKTIIKNFIKMRTSDAEMQKRLMDALEDALPETEPDDGYEEVGEMLASFQYDCARTEPTEGKLRWNMLRDHADVLFIDGVVYGAFLALGGKNEE